MGILAQDVYYSVDDTEILRGITAEFSSGFIGVIGPNGAGKTTLLRLLSGYLHPASGDVLLDGQEIGEIDVKTRARKMALVPQSSAMEYDFTVLETVLMGRNPHQKMFEADSGKDIALARESIRRSGIASLENRSIIGLSGGEWQRMIIARALCQQSSILLLDEPVANLDIKHQVGILNMVKSLVASEDLLCVCVLHDLNLAHHYCDSLLLMKDGRMYKKGTPKEVLTKENIEAVYGTKVDIIHQNERTYILPVMG
jgi:iron complex transport system ATP-binding protein